MGVIRIFFRTLILVLVTLGCTFVAAVGSALGGGHRFALSTQQFWSRVMLKAFGVKTVLHGELPKIGLLMANHQSYIDIWIVPKFSICVFVAKMEVKKMPLLGWGASSVNTVYVDRKDRESGRQTKKEIAQRIKKGRSVIIFPEGTTSNGNGMLPYRPGMFHVAAEERFPIIPVAIFYENPDLAWVGDDNMAGHFFRNFSKKTTTAHIEFGQPITGSDGEELMQKVRSWKLKRLEEFRKTYRHG